MKKVDKIVDKADYTNLKRYYMDACSNKDFSDFVHKLPIEEELLIKNTTSLEESFEECNNCKKCKDIDKCLNKIKGYFLYPEKTGNSITFSYIMCKKKEQEEAENEYKNNITYYEIPEELKKASFKDLYKDDTKRKPILKYITEFIDKYTKGEKVKGMYLNGSFGTGKTYIISALFNDLAKKGYKSAIVYYPDFLMDIKASFNNGFEDKMNYIKKVELLLLDDIGAENVSSYNRDEILGPILQYRMDQNLPTFFTSNLTLDELEKNLSLTTGGVDKVKARRIIERIKQLTSDFELISKNRRV